MRCAECDRLRAEVADLREQLAAWEDYDRAAPDADRIARWQDAFGVSAQTVRVLMALADAKGRVVSREHLVTVTRRLPDAKATDPHRTLAQVLVWKVRRRLDGLGLGGGIETYRGLGYIMAEGLRQRILAMVGEGA